MQQQQQLGQMPQGYQGQLQQQQQLQQQLQSQQQFLQQAQQPGGMYWMPMMMQGQPMMQDQGQGQLMTTAMMPPTAMPGGMPTTAMPGTLMPSTAMPHMAMAPMAPSGQAAPWVSQATDVAPRVSDDLVHGEVMQSEELNQGPVSKGIPEHNQNESQSISAAGKQLFGEALNDDQWDTNQQELGEPLSGTETGPISSPGSVLHGTGNCNPCAWFWKARGCAVGRDCDYCHLCPEGELKRRKKLKIQEIKSGAREPVNPRAEARGATKGLGGAGS